MIAKIITEGFSIAAFIITGCGGICLAWWIGESIVRAIRGKEIEPFFSV